MHTVQPLVTIDMTPQASQLPTLRPRMASGDLPLTTVEQYAPKLARELLDTFDFSDSVGKGKPASISIAKAYSQITTAQYRQLAKIDEFRKSNSAWDKGILGTLALAATGLGAALLGVAGASDFALGVISVLTGVGACVVTSYVSPSLSERAGALPSECLLIASELPLQLPAAKAE